MLEAILSDSSIDWFDGRYQNGVVKPPIPVLAKGSEALAIAARKILQIEASIAGKCPVPALATLLVKLQGHYWQPNMSDALARQVAEDYKEILSQYPFDVLQVVCRKCLLDPDRKFFPKVAELNEMAKGELWFRKWKVQRLQLLIEKSE